MMNHNHLQSLIRNIVKSFNQSRIRREQLVLSCTFRSSSSVAVAERKKNHFYVPEKEKEKDMNFFTAINSALSIAMSTDDTAILFGEDAAL